MLEWVFLGIIIVLVVVIVYFLLSSNRNGYQHHHHAPAWECPCRKHHKCGPFKPPFPSGIM